jgi:hypothetical protein
LITFNGQIFKGATFQTWLQDLTSLASHINSVFGSVVAGIFQITFRAKMHANDIFLFFKNHF